MVLMPHLRTAIAAALYPHIPCTPPPGGVDDEQILISFADVAY
jgi:hypothetical protein